MKLSYVENQMLETLRMVLLYLTQKMVNRQEYMNLMDQVKCAIQAGKNKQYGCPTGVHASSCACNENNPKQTLQYLRYGKRAYLKSKKELK